MIEYQNIQADINRVIVHSQNLSILEMNSDAMLEKWAINKEKFYHAFGDQLIYNVGPVEIHLNDKEKQKQFNDFYSTIQTWSLEFVDLRQFLLIQEKGFFDNIVVQDYEYKGKTIPAGMKLLKAFKFFVTDKIELDAIQTRASAVIQNDLLKGELCFSIHPLDYLSSSENTYNWRSCHALDGEYRGGNLSYMMDDCTVITYIKGINETVLPHFPEDVKWNSKKWRMLLFVGDTDQALYAGRQYPFDLGTTLLNTIANKFIPLLNKDKQGMDASGFMYWNPWHNDRIDSFKFSETDTTDFYNACLNGNYININGNLVKDKDIIQDGKDTLHFNDLIRSSCYIPYYTYNRYHKKIPRFNVGQSAPCPCCGTRIVYEHETLVCFDCFNNYGDGEDTVVCEDCGRRIHSENAYWIDREEYYVCPSCYDDSYVTCDCCGDRLHVDDAYHDEDGSWYCAGCWREDD